MKQKLIEIKGKIFKPTIILGDFNTLLSVTDRTCRQISKDTGDLNKTSYKFDLINIYRPLPLSTATYTFFLCA